METKNNAFVCWLLTIIFLKQAKNTICSSLKSAQKYLFWAQKRAKNGIFIKFFLANKQEKRSKNISVENIEEPKEDLFITFVSNTDYHTKIFEEINKEIDAFLKKESDNKDATGSALDLLSTISDSVQEQFEELICGDNNKKWFVRALSKIFALLLKTKVDTAEKIRRIIKIVIEMTRKIWQEPQQQQEDYLSKPVAYVGGSSTERKIRKNNLPIQNKRNTTRTRL